MDECALSRLKANLFPASHQAITCWACFPWHRSNGEVQASKPQSSQALAIDVFGTIAASSERDVILDAIAELLSLPCGGPWDLRLEWADCRNLLRELKGHPTRVDVMARNAHALMFLECKFMESDGGSCSQPRPLQQGAHKGATQCNGNYGEYTNPVNGKTSFCALAGKGIRYWDVIPRVFDYSAGRSYAPCPFAGPWFQWMRNITVAWAVAQATGVHPGFAIVYADAPGLPMAEKIGASGLEDFTSRLRGDAVAFGTVSFQEVIGIAADAVSSGSGRSVFRDLAVWVARKVEDGCLGPS